MTPTDLNLHKIKSKAIQCNGFILLIKVQNDLNETWSQFLNTLKKKYSFMMVLDFINNEDEFQLFLNDVQVHQQATSINVAELEDIKREIKNFFLIAQKMFNTIEIFNTEIKDIEVQSEVTFQNENQKLILNININKSLQHSQINQTSLTNLKDQEKKIETYNDLQLQENSEEILQCSQEIHRQNLVNLESEDQNQMEEQLNNDHNDEEFKKVDSLDESQKFFEEQQEQKLNFCQISEQKNLELILKNKEENQIMHANAQLDNFDQIQINELKFQQDINFSVFVQDQQTEYIQQKLTKYPEIPIVELVISHQDSDDQQQIINIQENKIPQALNNQEEIIDPAPIFCDQHELLEASKNNSSELSKIRGEFFFDFERKKLSQFILQNYNESEAVQSQSSYKIRKSQSPSSSRSFSAFQVEEFNDSDQFLNSRKKICSIKETPTFFTTQDKQNQIQIEIVKDKSDDQISYSPKVLSQAKLKTILFNEGNSFQVRKTKNQTSKLCLLCNCTQNQDEIQLGNMKLLETNQKTYCLHQQCFDSVNILNQQSNEAIQVTILKCCQQICYLCGHFGASIKDYFGDSEQQFHLRCLNIIYNV